MPERRRPSGQRRLYARSPASARGRPPVAQIQPTTDGAIEVQMIPLGSPPSLAPPFSRLCGTFQILRISKAMIDVKIARLTLCSPTHDTSGPGSDQAKESAGELFALPAAHILLINLEYWKKALSDAERELEASSATSPFRMRRSGHGSGRPRSSTEPPAVPVRNAHRPTDLVPLKSLLRAPLLRERSASATRWSRGRRSSIRLRLETSDGRQAHPRGR